MNSEANFFVITAEQVDEAEREKIEKERNRSIESSITAQNPLRLEKENMKTSKTSSSKREPGRYS
jgi:hypothetical protein